MAPSSSPEPAPNPVRVGEPAGAAAPRPPTDASVSRLHRLATVLAETNEAVFRAEVPADVFGAAVDIAVEHGGFAMAWLGMVDDAEHVVHPVAHAGTGVDYVRGLRISTLEVSEGLGPTGRAVRSALPVLCNDIAGDPLMRPWWAAAAELGFRSSGAFPLIVEGRVAGVLSVYAPEVGYFDPEERLLVERLAANIAYGWERLVRDAARRASEAALLESSERWRHGFEHAVVGTALVDLNGRFLQVNGALARLLGRTEQSMIGLDVDEVLHPDNRADRQRARLAALHGTSSTWSDERRFVRSDGATVWTITSASLVNDSSGVPPYFFVQYQDITARHEAESQARSRAAQQAAVATLGRQALSELDIDGLCNAAVVVVADVLGVEMSKVLELAPTRHELRLRSGVGWSPGLVGVTRVGVGIDSQAGYTLRHDAPVVVTDLLTEERFSGPELLLDHGVRSGISVVIRSGSEAYGVLGAHTRSVRQFTAEDAHFMESVANLIGSAISRSRVQDRIRHQSLHDPLTGLPNRTLLHDRLSLALARLGRDGGVVGVLLADLDRFKVVNDSLGHTVGDDLLRAVADRLEWAVRSTDTVARLGGDEFVIVCEGLSEADVVTAARRISEALDAPFVLGARELFTTASIGVALVVDAHTLPAEALRDADVAMYQAKAHGGACHAVFDPAMRAAAVSRLETEAALRRAIEQDRLLLHFQPILELQSGRVTGAEALVRWDDPHRGLIPPGDFIPLAEDTGLIIPIGRWVLAEACRVGARWAADHVGRDLAVGVNLSVRQFADPELVRSVERALEESGLAAGSLHLEITESALVADAGMAISLLGQLAALGVRISVDDFGTGQSSLAYLKRFPIETLKIDRTFVAGLGVDDKDSAIVAGTISLAHSLGLRVVAEGVETAEQLELLRVLGCDEIQGFLIARPMPAADYERYLSADVRW